MTIRVPSSIRGYMRSQANALMTDTCTIERLADAVDEAGAPTNTWETISTGTACRMITATPRFQGEPYVAAAKGVLPEQYSLILPADTEIAVQYRVTLDSDDSRWMVNNIQGEVTDEVAMKVLVIPETP